MSILAPRPDCSPNAMRLLYSSMITIRAGQEQRDFVVHKDLICARSKYFDGALRGGFQEAQTKIIAIDDVDTRVIKVFVGWIYRGCLSYAADDPEGSAMDDFADDRSLSTVKDGKGQEVTSFGSEFAEESPQTWYWHTLIRLFLFGDRFEVPTFCACVLDTMCIKYLSLEHGAPSVKNINHAFENTTERSPLRAFMTAVVAYTQPEDNSMEFWMALPKELLAAHMKASASKLFKEPCQGCFEDALNQNLIKSSVYCSGLSYKKFTQRDNDLCTYHQNSWG